MTSFKELIYNNIVSVLCGQELSERERAIISILSNNWGRQTIKQQDILEHKSWLAAIHKSSLGEASPDTLKREIRKTIRKLRVDKRLPIVHDHSGYFFPESEEELADFIQRLESEAKSRAASSLETYKIMKDVSGIVSPSLDDMDSIGNQIIRQTI